MFWGRKTGRLKQEEENLHMTFWMTPRHLTVRLANGLHIDVRESGDPAGIPLILMHGVSDTHLSWRPFAAELPANIRAIAITQRGHGASSKPQEGYDASAFAGDLAAFMDAMKLSAAHICAHSMSTWIAQRFARDYPERVLSLTLIGGFVTLKGNPALADMPQELAAMGPRVDPAYAGQFQRATLAMPVPPDFLELVIGESLKAPTRVWRAVFDAVIADPGRGPRIEHPALLLWGELDAFFTERDRRALRTAFASAELTLYDDLGHAPHWEAPEMVAEDVARFVLAQARKSKPLPARAG
jgi:non-heme chloroperoxidase